MTSDPNEAPATEMHESAPFARERFDWMRFVRRRWPILLGGILVIFSLTLPFLADSASERSDKAVAAAQDSIAAGKDDEAMAKLGEALQLNPQNRAAERAMAGIYLRKGQIDRAKSVYETLVSRDPNDVDGLVAMAAIALQKGDADGAESNAEAALALAPDNPDAKATLAMLKVQAAVDAENIPAIDSAAAEAQAVLQSAPDNLAALQAVIAAAIAGSDPTSALPHIDHAIELTGGAYEFEDLKITALQKSGQADAMAAQLEEMYRRFPDRPELADRILAIYDQQANYPAARALLLDRALRSGFAEPQTTALLDYSRNKGPSGDERALLDQIIAQAPDAVAAGRYSIAAVRLDTEAGHLDAATSTLQALLQKYPDGEVATETRTELARVELLQGRTAEATDLVDQVLAAHPGTLAALKLRAQIEIAAGNTPQALTALQAAIDQSPRDSEVMLLMAEAYEKSGAPALAGDRYALAVEYSNYGIQESLKDADYLVRSGRTPAAVEVLTRAIAAHPGNTDLLSAAARVYAGQLDWTRAQAMAEALSAVGTPEATKAAETARQSIIAAQAALTTSRQAIDLMQAGPDAKAADTARATGRLLDQGDPDAALAYMLDPARGSDPAVLTLRATLYALTGRLNDAETQLAALQAADPSDGIAFLALYRLLQQTGRADAASTLLDQALAAPTPPVSALLEAADIKTNAGDTAGSIALLEAAYQQNPQDADTAALLSRSIALDPQSSPDALRHARDLAEPLRSLARPLVLDTLGWIDVRLGNPGPGLIDLQSAGRILPDDPVIRFHRAMALYGLDRKFEARDELRAYLALKVEKPAADVAEAQAALEKLSSGE